MITLKQKIRQDYCDFSLDKRNIYRSESIAAIERKIEIKILFLLFRIYLINRRCIFLAKNKMQTSFRSYYISLNIQMAKTRTTEHYIDKNNASSRRTFPPLPPISISFYFEKQSWRKSPSTSHFSIIDPCPSNAARTFSLQFSCWYFLRRIYVCTYTFPAAV